MQNRRHHRKNSYTIARRFEALAGLLLFALIVTACGTGQDPLAGDENLDLLLAGSAAEEDALVLQDAVLSGTVDVRAVTMRRDLVEVRFFVDDPERAGTPYAVDQEAPFTMSLDSTALTDGTHRLDVAAVGDDTRGRAVRPAHASFRVDNGTRRGHGDESPAVDDDAPRTPPVDDRYDHLVQLHVDPNDGDDGAAGTIDEPIRTLNEGLDRAVDNRDDGRGTRIVLHSGTYREAVDEYFGSSGPLIVIQAAQEGTAVVSGSDVWDDWSCSGSVCSTEWTYDWGTESSPWPEADIDPIGQRREMVFVDGERLEQTLLRSTVESTPGSFYVDEGANRLYMRPPSGTSVSSSLVEVSTRARVFWAHALHDLVIDGVVFQHGASPVAKGAVYVIDQDRVTFENVVVRENNWDGLSFALGEDLTVRGSRMNDNGASGVTAWRTVNLLLEDSESNRNNWRGHAGGLHGWSVGNKFLESRDLVIRRHTSIHNLSRGLWLDYDVHDALLEDLYLCENQNDGIFIEASPGPIVVRNSTFCDNTRSGIQTSSTNGLVLEGNTLTGNERSQIHLTGDFGRPVGDWVTGETHDMHNENWTWRDNTLVSYDGAPVLTTTFPQDEWDLLMRTSDLDGSKYDATIVDAFELPGGKDVDFDEWQQATGQDRNSTFGMTATAALRAQ